MKKLLFILSLLPLLASAAGSSAILFNARYNSFNKTVLDTPFDEDFSYGLSYAVYDGAGYLEFGVNYAPDSSIEVLDNPGVEAIDDVWTPFVRLVMEDQFVAIGIGLRENYISFADESYGDSGWSDLLYELYAGIEIPFGGFVLGGGVYYTFDDWGDAFSDFKSDYLDYGVHFGFRF